jgi:Tfp pilus assembly protein PilN
MTPWADLLEALETAPDNLALLSVEPSAAKRSISLTAEAASPKDMLNYLRALQSDQRLSGVLLVSHQVQVQAPGAPLRFQIQGTWGGSP